MTPIKHYKLISREPTKNMMEAYYRAYETAKLNQQNDFTPIFHVAFAAAWDAAPDIQITDVDGIIIP